MTKVPLQDLPDEALRHRYHELTKNVCFKDQALAIPADVVDLFKETSDECTRRNLARVPFVKELIRIGDHPPILHETAIIRYGKRSHLEDLVKGIVSFGPSKLYRDAPIESQKDDETKRSCRQPNQVLTIGEAQCAASEIILSRDIAEIDGSPIDYHLFCASYEESLKLCRAFQADGFVKIRDCNEFLHLVRAALSRLCPSADIDVDLVRYYDDRTDLPPRQLNEMIRHKTVEYMYQREVRFSVLNGVPSGERFHIQIQPPEGLFEMRLYEHGETTLGS